MNRAALPASVVFRREITEASRLGFTAQTRVDTGAVSSTVFVRLNPTTPKARAACGANTGIEANQVYTNPLDMPDALRQAFTAALTFARDAGA